MLGGRESLSERFLQWALYWRRCLQPFKAAELYGAAGFQVDHMDQIGDAVGAALASGRPAVIGISVDPAALYSFRQDSFKHRGG